MEAITMTVRASGSMSPLRRGEKSDLEQQAELVAKFMREGLERSAAEQRAAKVIREQRRSKRGVR
jgi:hypothetical protein